MIVVDTTVWIDFLEERDTPFAVHLQELVEDGASVALTDIIYCEILQGIREDKTYRRTRQILHSYPILRVRGLRTFDRAAALYRDCRKRGLTIRSTVDCLIAAICIDADAELYHNDRDFDAIARVSGLKLYHA